MQLSVDKSQSNIVFVASNLAFSRSTSLQRSDVLNIKIRRIDSYRASLRTYKDRVWCPREQFSPEKYVDPSEKSDVDCGLYSPEHRRFDSSNRTPPLPPGR